MVGDALQVPLTALAFLLLLEQSVAAVKQHLETRSDSSGRKLFALWKDRAQQEEPQVRRMRQQPLICSSGSAPLHAHAASQPGSARVTSRLCDVPLSRWRLVALAKRGTLFLLSPTLPSLQPTPETARLPRALRLGAVTRRVPSLVWGLMSPGLSDVSSASQPLILVLLHFLAAQKSNEQSNPFCNLFLLLYSLEEVMTLEIASPGGRKGPDPNSPYTTVCLP